MGNSTKRDSDISKLHPAIRDKVAAIQKKLQSEKIPFEVFEAFRTPERQAQLFAKGRTKPGKKVTWVGPWGSIHQYGLAVDFVLKIDEKWSWDDKGARAKFWERMHELAKGNGMTPLFNKKGQLIEKPHIELIGVSATEMHNGIYPEGGDEIWAEYLSDLIDNWEGPGAAPPKPELAPERPPLDPTVLASLEIEQGSKVPDPISDAAFDPRFQKFHEFIKRWEGGFADHPADKGGATNMGITIGTLADWRGTDVTVEDVRNLTRAEADEIFRTRYYAMCRCGEMPERMAVVVYNCAVLSGPKRAIKFVQEAFNDLGLTVDGKGLEVDGVLGRLTMGAVQKTDAGVLADAFMDRQEKYLRSLGTFSVFGTGWMNRMAALREFVNTLPTGAGIRPTTKMSISEKTSDLKDFLTDALSDSEDNNKSSILKVAELILQTDTDDSSTRARNKSLLKLLLKNNLSDKGEAVDVATLTTGPDGKPPLTPINAALGETIGKAMNGKKSVSGIFGLLLTAVLPRLGISGDIIQFISANTELLLTVFSLLTGWGMFGKLDKAIRLVGMVNGRAQ
ncbi:D-alanyl-D-alanine carboxypeptidase family protein [Leisingera caerulea]|uniref:D-alanyl-D-alanine carboxypeptidase family protein n=1 Tax=Leisingera caerulea TaxID=506591 RepID=A0ABY5WZ03_LEICA|nr:glycosyl hydrolase 108 family protein [Leisingera caerulea]UWQ59348.1 D-alanyl-D-alanine carboxypeptidase family protein [Leisingera caerulea]